MAIGKRSEVLAPMNYWGPLSMMQEMERMLDNFRLGFEDMASTSSGPRTPAVDIRDAGDGYVVEAELPGIGKDEVSIEVSGEMLFIKAAREQDREEKGQGFIRRERGRTSFYRRIGLPNDVDQDRVGAKLENGVLRVCLPKRAMASGTVKKIELE